MSAQISVLIGLGASTNPGSTFSETALAAEHPSRWWTIPRGILAATVMLVLSWAFTQGLRLSVDKAYVTYLQSLPFILHVLLVVTAGVFEETLYRGYGVERLASLCGSTWSAGALTVTLFTVMHLPAVGWAHLPAVAIVGVLLTLLYP